MIVCQGYGKRLLGGGSSNVPPITFSQDVTFQMEADIVVTELTANAAEALSANITEVVYTGDANYEVTAEV